MNTTTTSLMPFDSAAFAMCGITAAWGQYAEALNWGRGQTLAILDDGFDISVPQWQEQPPWGPKLVTTYSSIDGGSDVKPAPGTGHGTTVGYASSLWHQGTAGVAYQNQVAFVRCVTHVHMKKDESETMAAGLRWVLDNRAALNITTVNLAPIDDVPHQEPAFGPIDPLLEELRQANIWVSAPCANNGFTNGISWPACQPACVSVGAVDTETGQVHRDRYNNTQIVVPADVTSKANAMIVGCAMVLREAIETSGFEWKPWGATLPEAMLAIMQQTGTPIRDEATGLTFSTLNILAALDLVFTTPSR